MAQKHPTQKLNTPPAAIQEATPTVPHQSSTMKWLPHAIAIGIFLLVTITYFYPVVFGGKEVFQEDIMRFKGVSKEIVDYREKTGKEALWTNSLFSGMPAYQISAQYLATNLRFLNSVLALGLPSPVRMVFFYFLGFYILMLVLKIDPWVGIMGALAFGLSSYFFIILDVGHNSKAMAIAYMAPVLAGFILTFRGKILAGGAMTAFFLTMEIYSNHPQITYYLGLLLFIYGIAEFVNALRAKKIADFFKKAATIGVAALIALGVNITSLWATADYSKYTIRGGTELTINPDGTKNENNVTSGLEKDYATAWSYGVGESMTLLIPNFKGGGSSPIGNNKTTEKALSGIDPQAANIAAQVYSEYFGDQPFTSGPVYAGAIVIFIFVLGMFVVKGPVKWALVIATIVSVWLSWGKNDPFGFSNFMLDHFPAYNKFRAVSMILVIAELTIPLLGVLAIDAILKNRNFLKENITFPFKQIFSGQKVLIAAFVLTGGIALLCWIAPEIFTKFSTSSDLPDVTSTLQRNGWPEDQIKTFYETTISGVIGARKEILKADAIRTFLFILLAAAALWLYAKNIFVNKKIFIGSFIVLILIDMVVIDRRYLNKESFKDKSEMKNPLALMGRPHAADLEIMKDTDPYFRVWNTLARPDQDAATSYFHKSIGGYHGAKLRRYQDLIDFHINRRNMSVINMLNTKYAIIQGKDNNVMAYPNRDALGNAWFVSDYRIVANPDSEIIALNHFDPSKTAIIDKRFEEEVKNFSPKKDSSGTIKLTSYEPNDLVYESNASSEQLTVFSEVYYPSGWNLYLDEKIIPHFRVNYILRAARIPAGKHKIEFKFEPKLYATGEKISAASMLLLLLLCGGSLFVELKTKKSLHHSTNGKEE